MPKIMTEATLRISDFGFTVLADGEEPVADIVFIHGLQGHPYRTWSCPGGKVKFSIREFFSKERLFKLPDTIPPVYWPRDLLPQDIKDARILTYGYDSHVSHFFSGPTSQNGIRAHGRALLNGLGTERRDYPSRALIFVVHSLGGLILKEVSQQGYACTSRFCVGFAIASHAWYRRCFVDD
jgi:hypothetical protein